MTGVYGLPGENRRDAPTCLSRSRARLHGGRTGAPDSATPGSGDPRHIGGYAREDHDVLREHKNNGLHVCAVKNVFICRNRVALPSAVKSTEPGDLCATLLQLRRIDSRS
jgi:hypothetical protein